MNPEPTIAIVDDDPDVRSSLEFLLRSVGMRAELYGSGNEYLARWGEQGKPPDCLLLDIRMPGLSGMALLEQLANDGTLPATVVVTGHGDIPMAVKAMKLGAVDFVTKPVNHQQLLDTIQKVLRQARDGVEGPIDPERAVELWGRLTQREREVFDKIAAGASNKVIAIDLGISIRTVETHRAHIMEKLEADSLVDLVLLAVQLKRR